MDVTARRWPAFLGWLMLVGGSQTAAAADAPVYDQDLEEIVVTGSRIQRRLEDAPVPVVVVDRDAIERASQDAIGKVLQQLPMNTGFSTNTGVNNGGDGTTRMNLRGLGAERTLVLVNGRRFVYGGNGGDTSVDLNMIPQSVVQRVEVVGVGASTIYGSDAIGGVVNLITREDYDGAEISGSYTTNDHGDGTIYDISFFAGQIGERGYVTFGGELVDQDPVYQGDREYSENTEYVRYDGSIGYGGSGATPQGQFRVPPGNALGLPGGTGVRYTRVDGSGNPPTADDFRVYDFATDFYNFAPINYLQTPSERQYFWALGGYDLSDSVSLFAEAVIHHRGSEQLLAPTPFFSGDPAAGSPILEDGEAGIPADNYYNPFGVDLEWPWYVNRRFSESVGRRYTEDAETQWYVAGLRGIIGDSSWNWELSADYGRNDTTTTTKGEFRSDRLQFALGSSGLDALGNVVCGKPDPISGIVPAENIIAGCVPLNLFGGQGPDGRGTITQAMLDYTSGSLTDRGYNEQQIYELTFRGNWGAVQGGDIKWAVGAARRVESSADKLDPAKLDGTAGGLQYNLSGGGQFTANEAYVEAEIPFLNGVTGAELLSVTGGLRYSDFSSFGSVTTYQGGLLYRPLRSLTLRGGYGTVFRAPPIVALYSSNLTSVNGYGDPCGNNPTPEQMVNCEAAGVPGGSYVQSEEDIFAEIIGGNPDLKPEEGDSVSAGVTFSPSFVSGLDLSLDYWRTSLDDVIAIDPYGGDFTQACADSGSPQACGRIQRNADGSIRLVDARNTNGASLIASGVDLDLGYATSLVGGSIGTRVTVSYLSEYDYVPSQGANAIHGAGRDVFPFGAFPQWRGLGYVEYARGGWSASYQVQYIGSIKECQAEGDGPPDGFVGCRRIDDRWYQDLRLQYDFSPGPTIAFAVNNLSGTDPPRVSNGAGANTYPWMYPLLGRSYFVQLSYRIE